jgi:hypothetical protein
MEVWESSYIRTCQDLFLHTSRFVTCSHVAHVCWQTNSVAVLSSLHAFILEIKLYLLKPTDYVMHQQVLHSTIVRSTRNVLCVLYLSENKQRLVHLHHKLIGFYNEDEKYLQRGTDCVFK